MVDFDALCEALSLTLSRPLPGDTAHERMAPSHRVRFNPTRTGAREGAVMILLFPEDGGVSTLFTLRRKDLADHAGQISFPGGRREDGETFQEAALRECEEEVGIAQDRIRVLGALTDLFIPPTRYIVHPFIGAL
ncbi:MAG TPA: CoA pyrophosphatase, partial [Rhodothermia bacterium]